MPCSAPWPWPLTTTTFVLSIPSIGAGPVVVCWGNGCLLCHTKGCGRLCLCSCFRVPPPDSFFPCNLSSFLLLSLQFLSRAIALLYHCSMEVGGFSDSINFLWISPFIPRLNSSTNGFLSYPLPLAACLNSCMNSSIVLSPCSSFLNSAVFTDFFSSPPNSFLKLVKNFSTDLYSISPDSNSSITFSFHTSADPSCTYDKIHYTCSSTVAPLSFILKNNLHTVIKPPTFAAFPLKMASFATSMWDPTLDLAASPPAPPCTASRACIWTCIATNCSCCCLMISCKFTWLILYWGRESIGEGDDEGGGGDGSKDVYSGKAEPVLVSLSDLYSDEDRIFSVGNSRSSSCPAYTVYWLLWVYQLLPLRER